MKKLAFILVILMFAAAFCGCRDKNKTETEGYMELFSRVCTANEGLSAARAAGAVIIENGVCTVNKSAMEQFYKDSLEGRAGKLLIASYNTLDKERTDPEYYEQEKDNYPMLFFCLVERFGAAHDGADYGVTVRKSDENTIDSRGQYMYLMHYLDDLPVQNEKYDKMEHYVLVNDNTVTWHDIEAAMVSSSLSTKRIDHYTIFFDFFKAGGGSGEDLENTPAPQANTDLFRILCSAEAGLSAAGAENLTITENSRCTNNRQAMEDFYNKTQRGEPAEILLALWYDISEVSMSPETYNREKDKYPQLFFELLEYDGEKYHVRVRKSDEDEPETDEYAPYLMHYKGNSMPSYSSLYSPYERYVLVNDNNVTWEQIERGTLSADFRDQVPHVLVFADLVKKVFSSEAEAGMFCSVLTAEEGLAAAKEAGAVVTEDARCTANKHKMEEFFEKAHAGEMTSVLVADHYRVDGDETGGETELTLYNVEYLPDLNGGTYRVSIRGSEDNGAAAVKDFKYLKHYTGEEQTAEVRTAYDRYVLVNDDALTWEQLLMSMLLSSYVTYGDFCVIFTALTEA